MSLSTKIICDKIFSVINKNVLCIYKPPDFKDFRKSLQSRILCILNTRPTREEKFLVDPKTLEPVLDFSYCDNALGPRFLPSDLNLYEHNRLPDYASGIQLVSINAKDKYTFLNHEIGTYELKGRLGVRTKYGMKGSEVTERCTYSHISLTRLTDLVDSMVSNHLNTAANDPSKLRPPGLLLSAKITKWDSPDFAIEATTRSAPHFLPHIIIELGSTLRTAATCIGLRRVSYSCFRLDSATPLLTLNINDLCLNALSTASTLSDYKKQFHERKAEENRNEAMEYFNRKKALHNETYEILCDDECDVE